MFEALKQNFLSCLMHTYEIELIADPKVEFYGQALEQVFLDLRMKGGDTNHDGKIKVHKLNVSLM